MKLWHSNLEILTEANNEPAKMKNISIKIIDNELILFSFKHNIYCDRLKFHDDNYFLNYIFFGTLGEHKNKIFVPVNIGNISSDNVFTVKYDLKAIKFLKKLDKYLSKNYTKSGFNFNNFEGD